MATFLHVLLIIAIVLVCLFVLSFIVYSLTGYETYGSDRTVDVKALR